MCVALVLTWLASTLSASRYRTAACSNTLSQGLEKIQAIRVYDCARIPTASSTAEVFNIVRSLHRNGKLDDVQQDKKQKAATRLLRDKLHTQDFAGPTSLPAAKVLGPISRYRIADILPHMKLASRASRPGLTVGFCASFATGYVRLKDFTVIEALSFLRLPWPGCP